MGVKGLHLMRQASVSHTTSPTHLDEAIYVVGENTEAAPCSMLGLFRAVNGAHDYNARCALRWLVRSVKNSQLTIVSVKSAPAPKCSSLLTLIVSLLWTGAVWRARVRKKAHAQLGIPVAEGADSGCHIGQGSRYEFLTDATAKVREIFLHQEIQLNQEVERGHVVLGLLRRHGQQTLQFMMPRNALSTRDSDGRAPSICMGQYRRESHSTHQHVPLRPRRSATAQLSRAWLRSGSDHSRPPAHVPPTTYVYLL